MLVPSERHTKADLEHWREMELADLKVGNTLEPLAEKAIRTIDAFAATKLPPRNLLDDVEPRVYVGVSWGKDSMVLAHLTWRLAQHGRWRLPVVWVNAGEDHNPYGERVRDAALEAMPGLNYHEIRVERIPNVGERQRGTIEQGFDLAAERFGHSYISGVRAEESNIRRLRVNRWGLSSSNTCAPLGYWTAGQVFGYLAHHQLPVHPVYAMTDGGRWDRERLRVGLLGGKRGDGIGRREWENRYFGDMLRRWEAEKRGGK